MKYCQYDNAHKCSQKEFNNAADTKQAVSMFKWVISLRQSLTEKLPLYTVHWVELYSL